MRTYSAFFLSLFSAAAFAAGLPQDIQQYSDRVDRCIHFSGEEPYDAARATQLKREVEAACPKIREEGQVLGRKYSSDPQARQALTQIESRYRAAFGEPAVSGTVGAFEVAIGGNRFPLKPGEVELRIPLTDFAMAEGELRLSGAGFDMKISPVKLAGASETLKARWAPIEGEGSGLGYLPVFWDEPRKKAYLGVWDMRGDRDHVFTLVEASLIDRKTARLFSQPFGGTVASFAFSPGFRYAAMEFHEAGDWGLRPEVVFVGLADSAKPLILRGEGTSGIAEAYTRFKTWFGKVSATPAGRPYGPDWTFRRFLGDDAAEVCLTALRYADCSAKGRWDEIGEECYRLQLGSSALSSVRRDIKKTKGDCSN